MKMNSRQFIVFVCVLMSCLIFFCLFMQSEPASNAWAMTGFTAFLVILLIFLYFFINFLIDAFADDFK